MRLSAGQVGNQSRRTSELGMTKGFGQARQADHVQAIQVLEAQLLHVLGRVSPGMQMDEVEQRLLRRRDKGLLPAAEIREGVSGEQRRRDMAVLKRASRRLPAGGS